jgi:hypothetical protein
MHVHQTCAAHVEEQLILPHDVYHVQASAVLLQASSRLTRPPVVAACLLLTQDVTEGYIPNECFIANVFGGVTGDVTLLGHGVVRVLLQMCVSFLPRCLQYTKVAFGLLELIAVGVLSASEASSGMLST